MTASNVLSWQHVQSSGLSGLHTNSIRRSTDCSHKHELQVDLMVQSIKATCLTIQCAMQGLHPDVAMIKGRLEAVFKEGSQSVAEFCGVCVEHLRALGTSLYTQARHKRKDHSFEWPESADAIAVLLRYQVLFLITLYCCASFCKIGASSLTCLAS